MTRILGQAAILLAVASVALAGPYRLPDAELMHPDFAPLPGFSGSASTLDGRADLPGPGVEYALTLAGADHGKMGIGDPWRVNPAAGLAPDPGVPGGTLPHANSSLADYDSYTMSVSYVVGPPESDINVALFLNTGLTGPSGFPSLDDTNNTFWGGEWFTVDIGETVDVAMLFDNAQGWEISDNKVPHTGGGLALPDGAFYAINDRDLHEISNIGIQIEDSDGDVLGSSIVLHLNVPLHADVIPEPATLSLLGIGALALLRRRRR